MDWGTIITNLSGVAGLGTTAFFITRWGLQKVKAGVHAELVDVKADMSSLKQDISSFKTEVMENLIEMKQRSAQLDDRLFHLALGKPVKVILEEELKSKPMKE